MKGARLGNVIKRAMFSLYSCVNSNVHNKEKKISKEYQNINLFVFKCEKSRSLCSPLCF